MGSEAPADRRAEAARELNHQENRGDGEQIVAGLDSGLAVLRDSLFARLHEDVESMVGLDSMLVPLSLGKAKAAVAAQVEPYMIAESATAAKQGNYVRGDSQWYVQWLAHLRLGPGAADVKVRQQVTDYLAKKPHQRRLALSDVLAKVLPESRRAPLVLFQVFPLAVHLATSTAFGDRAGAETRRSEQRVLLPAIEDCRECHGKLLEAGRQCPQCGNPLWNGHWLPRTD